VSNKKKNGIITYLVLVSAVLLTKVLGLLRGILLSQNYGTGMEASAFTAVSNLPLLLFDVTFGTAISSAFVPVFNEKLSKNGEKEANRFASNFMTIIVVFSLVISLAGILFPKAAVMLVASGFRGQADIMTLASQLMRIVMPIISFACATFIFIGILQSYGEFIAPALVSLFSNLSMILYFLTLNKTFKIHGLAVAFVLGWMLQFLFLIPFLKKKKFRYTFGFDLKSPDIRRVAVLTLPLFVAALAQPINQLISSNLSSSVGENGVATVNYAYNAYYIVAGVFSYALTNMFFPEMSRRFALKDVNGATVICKDMLSNITAIIMPIMAFMGACSMPIIKVLYQRGEFSSTDTLNVSLLLSVYVLGMIFLSWQDILNKFFYSMQKVTVPVVCAGVGIAINFLLSFLLTKRFGLVGLATSTVVAGFIMTAILSVFAVKITKTIFDAAFWIEMLKLTLSGVAVFVFSRFIVGLLNFDTSLLMQVIYVGVIFVASALLYLVLLFVFRSTNLKKILKLFRKGEKSC